MTVLTYEKVIMFSVQHRIELDLESEEALVYWNNNHHTKSIHKTIVYFQMDRVFVEAIQQNL